MAGNFGCILKLNQVQFSMKKYTIFYEKIYNFLWKNIHFSMKKYTISIENI